MTAASVEQEVVAATALEQSNIGGATNNDVKLNVGTNDKGDAGALDKDDIDKDKVINPPYDGEVLDNNDKEQGGRGTDAAGRSDRATGRRVKFKQEDARDLFGAREVSQREDYADNGEEVSPKRRRKKTT